MTMGAATQADTIFHKPYDGGHLYVLRYSNKNQKKHLTVDNCITAVDLLQWENLKHIYTYKKDLKKQSRETDTCPPNKSPDVSICAIHQMPCHGSDENDQEAECARIDPEANNKKRDYRVSTIVIHCFVVSLHPGIIASWHPCILASWHPGNIIIWY